MGIVQSLAYVGNEAVKHAREQAAQTGDKYKKPEKPQYTVRTGNLVSSVGYVLTADGQKVIGSNFDVVRGAWGDGSEGSAKGKVYADTLASEDTHEMSLVVVAGMPYGKYVQAKGYDVLNSAELLAKKLAKQKIQEAIKEALK